MAMEAERLYREQLGRLWAKTGDRCWYCGEPGRDGARTIDHVIAGGGDQESNLVAACKRCNGHKGPRSAEAFRDSMARYKAGWPPFSDRQLAWLRSNSCLPTLPRYEFYGETIGLSLSEGEPQESILPTGLPRGSEGFRRSSTTGSKGDT